MRSVDSSGMTADKEGVGEENVGEETPHLAKFVIAKKRANNIFNEAELLLKDGFEFYRDDCETTESQECINEISLAINRIRVIRQILTRDVMKVAFFGRTSNGKSSVINAILGHTILPHGIGHTTSCFISMRGCDETEPYMIVPESHDRRNINDLKQLARAVSDSKLGPNSLINVYWPVARCPVLEHQVAFLDSPGIDVDHDLDVWIDKYCRDADVFVLVVNSESTLNYSEKKFFHAVNQHISSPNIFILNNRWDASSYESDIEAIKDQHLTRCVNFLTKELECATHEDAIERVYFISAQEALYYKKKVNSNIQDEYSSQLKNRFEQTPGFKQRVEEFLKFEDKLQFSLYRSAISTKFTSHCSQADAILYALANNIDITLSALNNKKNKIEINYQNLLDQKKRLVTKTMNAFDRFEKEIHETAKNIQNKLYYLLCDELQNLPDIVKSFNHPFNSDPAFVDLFLNELMNFTKGKIQLQIQTSARQDAFSCVQKIKNKIKDFTEDLSRDDNDPLLLKKIEEDLIIEWYDDFDVSLIYSDFNYDINFKFFFNPISLYRSLSSKFSNSNESFLNNNLNISEIEESETNPSNLRRRLVLQNNSQNLNTANPIVQKSIDDLSATITTSTCLMMGVATKFVGYRAMAAVSSVIILIFLTKWMLWTNSAKRESLIRQFVYFSESRYKGVFEMISQQNKIIIERHLKNFLRDVKFLVESFTSKIDIEISNNQIEIQNINKKIEHCLIIRKKCRDIQEKLESFCIDYELHTKKNS